MGLLTFSINVTLNGIRAHGTEAESDKRCSPSDVFDYIKRLCNPIRRRSRLDYLSLMDFQQQAREAHAA